MINSLVSLPKFYVLLGKGQLCTIRCYLSKVTDVTITTGHAVVQEEKRESEEEA